MTTRLHPALVACAAFACAAIMAPAARAQDASAPAIFRVVHGIPGRDVAPTLDPQLPVDVLVNGKICLLHGLTFGTVAGPFSVPAGSYDVQVSLANSVSPCSNAPVITQRVTLTAGEEAAVVAALSPAGKPLAYALALDFQPVPAVDGRVIVAHTADAPAVDVTVDRKRAIVGLKPGTDTSAQLPAGSYKVAVFPTGGTTPVIGPVGLKLVARGVTLVFAVGSATSGSITLVTKTITGVF